jgi:DNA invertase Pin-like site-specific DNA recombinase
MNTIVSYLRVSTKNQGANGLGIEAQRAQILTAYPTSEIFEFLEVQSGKKNNRKILASAMLKAKELNCTLVVAKLDRLSRDASFLMQLHTNKLNFVALDMPELNTLTLGIFASVAQYEREKIVDRVKKALEAKKVQCGGCYVSEKSKQQGTENLQKNRAVAVEAIKQKAKDNENNKKAKGYILLLKQSGFTLKQITERLNNEGFKTSRGSKFLVTTVVRLLAS